MLMFGKVDRLEILTEIDRLIELHYGSYTELLELTLRDVAEIETTLQNKEQKKSLAKSGIVL